MEAALRIGCPLLGRRILDPLILHDEAIFRLPGTIPLQL